MGKGSSKGHTPREAKDNLKSTQLLSVIDAISEGPVEGPVDGLKSVLLNSTPVLDSEGNTNISGVTVVFRPGGGHRRRDLDPSGSRDAVLGTEVKYDTPITRTVTSANIDRLRFTFRCAGTGGNHLKGGQESIGSPPAAFRYSVTVAG